MKFFSRKKKNNRFLELLIRQAEFTVQGMEVLKLYMQEPQIELAERLFKIESEAAVEIHRGVLRLVDHPNVANDHAVRAKALENRVEHVYREALADLFQETSTFEEVMEILKYREIYRHLSNAADRGDQAANA